MFYLTLKCHEQKSMRLMAYANIPPSIVYTDPVIVEILRSAILLDSN